MVNKIFEGKEDEEVQKDVMLMAPEDSGAIFPADLKELDQEHEEQQDCSGRTKPSDPVGQLTKFDLEGGGLIVSLQTHQNFPIRAVRANAGDEISSDTLENL